jgi:CheY-like chemotaxis protein
MARIMVVDDDSDVIYVHKLILSRAGFEVVGVESCEECLEKLDEISPDLVVMDIMMPGMDGWEACRKIKERNSHSPPVVMVSVRRDEEDIRKSLEYARADAHLPKPLNKDELVNTIRQLLGSLNE